MKQEIIANEISLKDLFWSVLHYRMTGRRYTCPLSVSHMSTKMGKHGLASLRRNVALKSGTG